MDSLPRIRAVIKDKRLDAFLVSSVPNITYLTNYSNFSIEEREAFLLITSSTQFIFTDPRYSEAVKNNIPNFKLIEKSQSESYSKALERICNSLNLSKVGFEGDNLLFNEFEAFKKSAKLVNFSLGSLRIIKNQKEIKAIEEACKLGDDVFTFIKPKIKKGVSEKELASEIEIYLKKQNANISFEPIVAFGKNSSVPHHQSGDTKLSDGFVLFDLGAKLNNYCSDMTRTVFYKSASSKQKNIYKTVLEAQQKAVDFISKSLSNGSRILAKDVDQIAREYIKSKGYPNMSHSLGHSIGLEVHEAPKLSPNSQDELLDGMIFSIEPGIYLENFGGVRIEDLYLIEAKKLRQLTSSKKDLLIIN